jgi:hypothetical protein
MLSGLVLTTVGSLGGVFYEGISVVAPFVFEFVVRTAVIVVDDAYPSLSCNIMCYLFPAYTSNSVSRLDVMVGNICRVIAIDDYENTAIAE